MFDPGREPVRTFVRAAALPLDGVPDGLEDFGEYPVEGCEAWFCEPDEDPPTRGIDCVWSLTRPILPRPVLFMRAVHSEAIFIAPGSDRRRDSTVALAAVHRARHAGAVSADDPAPFREIPYGSATLRVLGETQGLSIGEMEVPVGFMSPPPAIHNGFDEALYVVSGQITVVKGHDHPKQATAGTLFLIPRGTRHAFVNETDEPAHILGMWSPGSALRFVTEIGAALPAKGYPNLEELGEVYRRFHSELAV